MIYTYLKRKIKKNKYLTLLLPLAKRLPGILTYPADYTPGKHRRGKPRTLQLPITYKCNFNCVMCGMQNLKTYTDWTPAELENILQDSLFSKIESVGINGGEPFIKTNITEYITIILKTLPKLKAITFISNGYFTKNMLKTLLGIKKICTERNVRVTLGLSLDGIGKAQDFLRGKDGAFEQIERTYDEISKTPERYYDEINFLCCITKHNIYAVNEVEAWAAQKGAAVRYNLAALHERVANAEKHDDFTVFNEPLALQMTAEFFYSKYYETKSQVYFCYYYLLRYGKRIAQCGYQYNNEVTLLPNKQLAYCSTYSCEIGDASRVSAEKLFYENFNYKDALCEKKCTSCFHPTGICNREGLFIYLRDILKSRKLFY